MPIASKTYSSAVPIISILRRSRGDCHQTTGPKSGRLAMLCESDPLWRSSQEIASDWSQISLDLSQRTAAKDYKLILEGTIPAGYPDARICVDNITSYTETCSELEPKPVKANFNWAYYFGLTFIVALALGLIVPVFFLVVIILVCRRRHQLRHSSYANSKLFSTNLWHYIGGGKEFSEDPFSEHTLLGLHRGGHLQAKYSGAEDGVSPRSGDLMDLPDVVIPGGRVVSMAYNTGTLGQRGTTLRQANLVGGLAAGKQGYAGQQSAFSQARCTVGLNEVLVPLPSSQTPITVVNSHQQPMIHSTQGQAQLAPIVAQMPHLQTENRQQAIPAVSSPLEDDDQFILPAPPTDSPLISASPLGAELARDSAGPPVEGHTTEVTGDVLEAVGERPPPGYAEAVGIIGLSPSQSPVSCYRPAVIEQQANRAPVPTPSAHPPVAPPVLPPRRAGVAGPIIGRAQGPEAVGLSLAERYGLPVAEI